MTLRWAIVTLLAVAVALTLKFSPESKDTASRSERSSR